VNWFLFERDGCIRLDTVQAVNAMQSRSHLVQSTLEVAQRSGEALEEIARSISQINECNLLIASATEEQALVAREVDRNLVEIRNVSDQVSVGGAANPGSKFGVGADDHSRRRAMLLGFVLSTLANA
jgi:methyl-accepting chemotaxis protein